MYEVRAYPLLKPYGPDLPKCVATDTTFYETGTLTREAITFHIETLQTDEQPAPTFGTSPDLICQPLSGAGMLVCGALPFPTPSFLLAVGRNLLNSSGKGRGKKIPAPANSCRGRLTHCGDNTLVILRIRRPASFPISSDNVRKENSIC